MNFDEVENLNQENIMELYDNIMEFGDDTHLAACCCYRSRTNILYIDKTTFGVYYAASCWRWCRGHGMSCESSGETFAYCDGPCS